jgi:hypothetical protein
MKAPNRLSVGELLLEGDLTARRLLLDPDALDAAAMVRTWPEVVQAGHEFLAILPRRGGGPGVHALPGARSQDQTGERLQLMATSMHQHFATGPGQATAPPTTSSWPSPGTSSARTTWSPATAAPHRCSPPPCWLTPPSPANVSCTPCTWPPTPSTWPSRPSCAPPPGPGSPRPGSSRHCAAPSSDWPRSRPSPAGRSTGPSPATLHSSTVNPPHRTGCPRPWPGGTSPPTGHWPANRRWPTWPSSPASKPTPWP